MFISFTAVRTAAEARCLYVAAFPNRRTPCERTFIESHRKLREHRSFHIRNNDGERKRFVRTVDVEENILHRIDKNPSIRVILREIEISHCTV